MLLSAPAFAQSGSSGGSTGGGAAGGAGSAGTSGSATSGTMGGAGSALSGTHTRLAPDSRPLRRLLPSGQTAPNPFPTVPQTGRGAPQVPSSNNAGTTSPLNPQNQPLGGSTNPAGASTIPNPPGVGTTTTAPAGQAMPSTDPLSRSGGTSTTTGTTNGTSLLGTTQAQDPSSTDPTTGNGAAQSPSVTDPTQPLPQAPRIEEIPGGSGRPPAGARQQTGSNTPTSPSSSGGASGATFEECSAEWDASSHMTRAEWKAACARLGR